MAERNVYQRKDKKWAWQLKADNGKIVAVDGSQGYENELDCRAMADKVVGGTFKDARKTRSPLPEKKS